MHIEFTIWKACLNFVVLPSINLSFLRTGAFPTLFNKIQIFSDSEVILKFEIMFFLFVTENFVKYFKVNHEEIIRRLWKLLIGQCERGRGMRHVLFAPYRYCTEEWICSQVWFQKLGSKRHLVSDSLQMHLMRSMWTWEKLDRDCELWICDVSS